MKITAAICTYNRERYLPQLFDSIVKQSLSKEDFQVVLVNNNSPGNTEEICREFHENHPEIQFVYALETSQGLSFARNKCIELATGESITFLDDDAFIAEDYLEKIVNYFDKNADFAAIGSRIYLHWENEVADWENPYINQILGFYDLGDEPKNLKFPDYPRGSNMSFRTEIFKEIGLFNVELGRIGKQMLGGEEKDLFGRIYATHKYIVRYVPDALVFHCVPIERTTDEFVSTQAKGIGKSEKIRTLQLGSFHYFKALIKELVKWMGSFGISLLYLVQGHRAKSKMILKFRRWVSIGLLIK
jgi:glycosyltransferase involved in cell wall biosynthesis